MNALIPIREQDGRQAVSGRDLHQFLGLGRDYTTWFKSMIEYGFVDGQDFTPVRVESLGGRPGVDHVLTLDMAKELAMIQRTDRGKQARQYFIEVEKRAKQNPAVPDISTPEGILALAQQFTRTAEELVAKKNEVAELVPRAAQADTFRQAEGLRTITDLANDLKVHAQANFPGLKVKNLDLFDLAGIAGLIIRGNTVRNNQPTARAIEAGWVKPKDTTVDTNNHGSFVKVSARLTPRGYGRLWDAAINNLNAYGEILPPKNGVTA